jgi:transposase-like protein
MSDRRKYTPEYKAEAVELAISSGPTCQGRVRPEANSKSAA